MLKLKMAVALAVAAILASVNVSAWGCGRGGAHGRPGHVIQAEQQKTKAAGKTTPNSHLQQAPKQAAPAVPSQPAAPPAATVDQKSQPATKEAAAGVVTVTGRNYCVSCRAWRKGDSMSECDKNGHQMIFRVREARDAQGDAIPDLKGRVLHYTPNENAQRLSTSKEYLNKVVTLTGALSPDRRDMTVSNVAGASKSSETKPAADASASKDAGHRH